LQKALDLATARQNLDLGDYAERLSDLARAQQVGQPAASADLFQKEIAVALGKGTLACSYALRHMAQYSAEAGDFRRRAGMAQ